MSLPSEIIPVGLLATPAAGGAAAYTIDRSLRFNSGDSAYLSKVFSSAGNRRTWTYSFWLKKAAPGGSDGNGYLSSATTVGSTTPMFVVRDPSDQLDILNNTSGGSTNFRLTTTAVYRDFSAWYHILLAVDTTQVTASNRAKLYVNGAEVTQFSTATYPAQNTDLDLNGSITHNIGREAARSNYYSNFFLADVHFIDGQALDPTSFGEFDEYNNWQPKAYTGSYGTNGFKLDFSDATSTTTIAEDSSGNNNDWTANNISVTAGAGNDSLFDSPTNSGTDSGSGGEVSGNYATLNPLANSSAVLTYSNGNLDISSNNSGSYPSAIATIGVSSGKWYWEFVTTSSSSNYISIGIAKAGTSLSSAAYSLADAYVYLNDGRKGNNNATPSYGAAYAQNDVVGVALDLDAGTLTFYKNNTSQGQAYSGLSGTYMPLFGTYNNGTPAGTFNFGQRPFAYDINIGISEATGAIPILSTSDDYGQTLSSGTASDSNSSSLVLALPMNGTNGGTTFTDYSATIKGSGSAKTITVNGDAQTSTTQSKWYGSSGKFDGSGDYLTAASSSDFNFGTGDFTIEAWIYLNSLPSDNGYPNADWIIGWGPTDSNPGFDFAVGSTNIILAISNFASPTISVSHGISAGGWYHVAATRSGSTARVFVNGIQKGSATTSETASTNPNGIAVSAAEPSGATGGNLNGYIQDLRVYNGVAKYTSNFTPPSSALFKALCTANLDEPTVPDGSTAMDVALWTGNGSTQTISGLGFNPDLVYLKERSSVSYPTILDSVRGPSKRLFTHLTDAETTGSELTSFNSDGFSLGVSNGANESGQTYVGWTWDAGSSTVSNTDGSITSSVRANPTAGFSIVTYTGTGVQGTIGHGLGIAPMLIITKARTGGGTFPRWSTYHKSIGATNVVWLDITSAATSNSNYWVTDPTSTVFTVGNDVYGPNVSPGTYVAYCFAPVEGYSAFGSYTGNASSSDGPFIYTGFIPRWIMIKNTSNIGGIQNYASWLIIDTARDTFNVSNNTLWANQTAQEDLRGDGSTAVGSNCDIDILSNGFKIRTGSVETNGSGNTMVYAAFAEHPFRTSRAR